MPAVSPEDPSPLENDQPLNFKIITHRLYQACLVYSRANLVVGTHEASLWALAPQLYLGTQADDFCRSDGQSPRVVA